MSRKSSSAPSVETAPDYITTTIASLLTHVVGENDHLEKPPVEEEGLFTTAWKYDWVLFADYVDRLKEWIVCGPESYVVAMCYLKQLEQRNVLPILTTTSVHRVFFACLMLAVKVTEDETLNNADFAKVACIQLNILNEMELFLLNALNFVVTVSVDEFVACKRELIHIDLLLTKSKTGKVNELARLGRVKDPQQPLRVSNMTADLKAVTPKRYFASTIPFFKDKRNHSVEIMETPDVTGLSKKTAVPSVLPSFMKRRISLEMFRNKSLAPTLPVTTPKDADHPVVLFRQDSA